MYMIFTKQITDENILYRMGNSTQRSVVTNQKELKKEEIHVCIQLIHFAVQ